MLDAPLWKPPSPRWRGRPGRTPRRLRGWSFGAVGEGRERVRARLGCRTSTASGWGLRPLRFPKGESLPVMRACWGLRPFAPQGSPFRDVCRSCANAHGTASETAFAATPPQICAEAPAAKRLGVPSLPSRGCAEGTLARPQGGNPKGGAALFGQSLPTFCWPESRGPARPERVEGKSKILRRYKRGQKSKSPRRREIYNFKEREEDNKKAE